MKKLMMAIAVVCAAVSVQAASTMWAANTSTKLWYAGYTGAETPGKLADGTAVYLIAATAATGSSAAISQAKLVSAFQNATTENPFNLASYAVPSSAAGSISSGKLNGSGSAIAAFTNSGDFENGASYNFYLAALVKDTSTGKSYLYVTDSVSKNAGASASSTVTINSFNPAATSKAYYGSKEYDEAGWYTTASAVPEPTSGLLLLLGMAGLALRRRRA